MNPGGPAPAPLPADPGIPLIPELPNPLIADYVRMRELEDRMALYLIGVDLSDEVRSGILASQTVIEKKVEAASDGFNPNILLDKRVRGIIFYPRSKLLSSKTYLDYVKSLDMRVLGPVSHTDA